MTIKTSISFTDRHHQFANKKATEGVFASVSSVVAAGIELVMQDEAERDAALLAMGNTIKRRMETPQEKWVELDDEDALFSRARSRLQNIKS